MPVSALDSLNTLQIQYPMMFSIQSLCVDPGSRTSHCGVLEFTAEEGSIYAPQWIMDSINILNGHLVLIKSAGFPKGTFLRLQPHTTDFINLSNPRAVLERTLQNFACLTAGDTITISHNSKNFMIDVLDTEPSPAISIIDTDCEVDFAPPLDYKEPEKEALKQVEEDDVDRPKFVAFSGFGKRLDGAAVAKSSNVVAEKLWKDLLTDDSQVKKNEGPAQMSFDSNMIEKKVLKGSDGVKKEEENKFEPFTGKKNVIGLGGLY